MMICEQRGNGHRHVCIHVFVVEVVGLPGRGGQGEAPSSISKACEAGRQDEAAVLRQTRSQTAAPTRPHAPVVMPDLDPHQLPQVLVLLQQERVHLERAKGGPEGREQGDALDARMNTRLNQAYAQRRMTLGRAASPPSAHVPLHARSCWWSCPAWCAAPTPLWRPSCHRSRGTHWHPWVVVIGGSAVCFAVMQCGLCAQLPPPLIWRQCR